MKTKRSVWEPKPLDLGLEGQKMLRMLRLVGRLNYYDNYKVHMQKVKPNFFEIHNIYSLILLILFDLVS